MSKASDRPVMVITGTRKGIGKYLVEYYTKKGFDVVGCSRSPIDWDCENYVHFPVDVADEKAVMKMFSVIRKTYRRLDVLVNNAGIASMNHVLFTPLSTVTNVFATNVAGTFLFCREGAKIMSQNRFGRIVNFATVATPLRLEGESAYAASKAAIESLTRVMAYELAGFGITVNAVGPTPIETDLIRSVPKDKMQALINRQAVRRYGEFSDITNVIDFFIQKESSFITGQVIFLGGVS